MDFSAVGWWIIDDAGFPKKGTHSVGVTRQYGGVLVKQDSCQVAVGVAFATKLQIALQQVRDLLNVGAPHHCVLADAGYGIDYAFRQSLSDLGLHYLVGITSAVVVWSPGLEPLPPKRCGGMGRPPVTPRRIAKRQPVNVKTLAQGLRDSAFHSISWREGTNDRLRGRFAALRVPCAGGNVGNAQLTLSAPILARRSVHHHQLALHAARAHVRIGGLELGHGHGAVDHGLDLALGIPLG